MTLVVLLIVSSVGSFAMGVWQGWILRRPKPRAPLLRVPRFERASLVISEGCIVEMGAIEIGPSGAFDIVVEPRSRESSVIVGDA